MKHIVWIMMMLVLLVACGANDNNTDADVTLEPSQIAANIRVTPVLTATLPRPTSEAVLLQRNPTQAQIETSPSPAATEVAQASATQAASPTPPITIPTIEPSPLPTSNHVDIQTLVENPNLLLAVNLESTCFLADDFIPFQLTVTSLETQPIYFYKSGQWKLSINNSPLGPQLTSRDPTLRDEFVDIPPNESFSIEEEDLGLWVLSLGPDSGIPFTPTGLGLPTGDYWVTFVYSNDQDGLKEQIDGTYLLDRAAWQGTAVAPEVQFKVVSDLADC
jgi:hypothetical protein